MKVTLAPELERFVAEKVQRGLYRDASEVLNEGLRLLKALEEGDVRADALREAVDAGIREADRGEVVDGPSAFASVLARASGKRAP